MVLIGKFFIAGYCTGWGRGDRRWEPGARREERELTR